MEFTTVFDAISRSYSKYFITIKDEGNELYAIWGEDASDKNDKLLVDAANYVMLFADMFDALRYIVIPSTIAFDRPNMHDWAEACLELQPSSSYTYDLNHVLSMIDSDRFGNLAEDTREECWEVLNVLHLISDYAYQSEDKQMIDIYRGKPISVFSDYVYDNYFWTIPTEEIQTRNGLIVWESYHLLFKQNLNALVQQFKSRFLYYSG
ncbi:hypothetical protein [Spirosoma sp. KNUC1025]|uniref:hypothetical protein n=1 Tax=Spirosoma sp. KNUC1025 TaxID=2894082 RepID=UPI003866DEB8|nr:hypothetical protein LN737_11415 [Spirosoma sp. KNUC1025]